MFMRKTKKEIKWSLKDYRKNKRFSFFLIIFNKNYNLKKNNLFAKNFNEMQIMEKQRLKDLEKLEKQALNEERLKDVKSLMQFNYFFYILIKNNFHFLQCLFFGFII